MTDIILVSLTIAQVTTAEDQAIIQDLTTTMVAERITAAGLVVMTTITADQVIATTTAGQVTLTTMVAQVPAEVISLQDLTTAEVSLRTEVPATSTGHDPMVHSSREVLKPARRLISKEALVHLRVVLGSHHHLREVQLAARRASIGEAVAEEVVNLASIAVVGAEEVEVAGCPVAHLQVVAEAEVAPAAVVAVTPVVQEEEGISLPLFFDYFFNFFTK